MVDKIYQIKNELIDKVDQELKERGPERLDGDMVDMIKDLAQAEECCMKARYYKAVTEAMEHGQAGTGVAATPYSKQASMDHGDLIGKLAEEYRSKNPDERMRMKNQVLSVLGAM